MRQRGARRAGLALLLVAALAGGSACSSSPARKPAPSATPQVFDFTKNGPRDEAAPVDPRTCKHVWVPIGTHPYQVMVNGMPMTRLCFVLRCERCGLVRHECQSPRARP
jgi:hypothetical protein